MMEQAYWNHLRPMHYHRMRRRHEPLWGHVIDYIHRHKVDSVLEVGGGIDSRVKRWVDTYSLIDLNENTEGIHGDFREVNIEPWRGVDLFVACGVIEHLDDGYELFLRRVKELQPKGALIGFFNHLKRDENICRKTRRGFWRNRYSKNRLTEYLNELGFRFEFVRVTKRDTLLCLS